MKNTKLFTLLLATVVSAGNIAAIEPIASEPIYAEPLVSEPIYAEPLVSESVYREPLCSDPAYREPNWEPSVTSERVIPEPQREEPTYQTAVNEQRPAPQPEPTRVEHAREEPAPAPAEQPKEVAQEPQREEAPAPVVQPVIIFKTDKKFLSFSETGGSQKIQVESNTPWEVYSTPEWAKIRKSGNTLTVICDANTQLSDREEDLILSNKPGHKIVIAVAQDRNSDFLNLSANLVEESDGDGGRYTIQVSSNKPYKVSETPQWCSVNTSADKLVLSIEENRSGSERQCEVVVEVSERLKKTIRVKQSPLLSYLDLSANLVEEGDGDGGRYTIQVSSNKPFKVNETPQWCSVNASADKLVLSIEENRSGSERQCEVVVEVSERLKKTIHVKQAPLQHYIIVSPQIVTCSKRGGSITVHVDSDGEWRVINLPEWCEVTDQTNDSFRLKIGPNNADTPRSATFSVSAFGTRKDVTVKQQE